VKYDHLGIPTNVPQEGEFYMEAFDTHITDHESNPYGIQWMRYGPNCRLPEIVKTMPHIGFEVDDLDEALKGQEILIQPNSPSPGVVVAFILCDGAPVELLQYRE